jgi:aldose 1-epimerase
MEFSIRHKEEKGLELVCIGENKTGTEISVLPALGGLLHGFSIRLGDESFNVVDHYGNLDEAREKIDKTFKSARLSPFTCRVARGKYIFDSKSYEFKNRFTDGSAIHGILYNKPFRIIGESSVAGSAALTLLYDYTGDDPGYPFPYSCEVRYTLLPENLMQMQTRVLNKGKTRIPIADGWHPYFMLGGKADDWLMHFNAKALVRFDDHLIPTGELADDDPFKEPRRIGPVFLDHCFLLDISVGRAACELFNPENKLRLSFFPDSSYPYLQIYTPPHRKSIAIENMSAAPDCFNNGMGLLLLDPGNSHSFTVYYQLGIV